LFTWGAGGDFISEKGEIKINEKNVINGINYAISFYKEGLVPKEYLDKNREFITLSKYDITSKFDYFLKQKAFNIKKIKTLEYIENEKYILSFI